MNYKSNPFMELMRTNIDLNNGIRYSTVYGNDILPEAIDDIIQSGTDLTYENYIEEMKESFKNHIKEFLDDNYISDRYIDYDQMFDPIQESINDRYESDSTTWEYNRDGYIIKYHSSDNSLTILKSPYYTFAQLASPCFPNGCYLMNHTSKLKGGYKCYCLDKSWFEGDKAPYKYFALQKEESSAEIKRRV